MREIAITKGCVALVDDEDYERVTAMGRWECRVMGRTSHGVSYRYAQRKINGRSVMMHRFILDAPRGMVVDHINHDGLDNRRANLRLCTHAENMRNRIKPTGTSSRFTGVYWHKYGRRWAATCQNEHLGLFKSEVEAALAYDAVARERFGEFVTLNFPSHAA